MSCRCFHSTTDAGNCPETFCSTLHCHCNPLGPHFGRQHHQYLNNEHHIEPSGLLAYFSQMRRIGMVPLVWLLSQLRLLNLCPVVIKSNDMTGKHPVVLSSYGLAPVPLFPFNGWTPMWCNFPHPVNVSNDVTNCELPYSNLHNQLACHPLYVHVQRWLYELHLFTHETEP
jgi:hypothetical protein